VSRFDVSTTFHGDLDAAAAGVMLSYRAPRTGAAGYVAIERVRGVSVTGREASPYSSSA
jgi:Protein of unknown function (DUF3224)